MHVRAGQPFTATLLNPSGLDGVRLGARIEVPVTRAIAGYWQAADLVGFVWSVQMDAPPRSSQRPPEQGGDPAMDQALAAGAFQLVWMDDAATPTVEIFVPLFTYTGTGPDAPIDWPDPDPEELTPSADEVAILVRTRTYTDSVEEQLVFTDETRPSVDDVDRLLAQAVPAVLSQLRPRFPERFYNDVRHIIALYTAVLIEGSFFREQITESQVALYRDLITDALAGINRLTDAELAQINAGALRLA